MPFFDKKPQGKPFKVDGHYYYHLLPLWQRPLYKLSTIIQWSLWKCGINWHNTLADECTPDGSCCHKHYDDQTLESVRNSAVEIIEILKERKGRNNV